MSRNGLPFERLRCVCARGCTAALCMMCKRCQVGHRLRQPARLRSANPLYCYRQEYFGAHFAPSSDSLKRAHIKLHRVYCTSQRHSQQSMRTRSTRPHSIHAGALCTEALSQHQSHFTKLRILHCTIFCACNRSLAFDAFICYIALCMEEPVGEQHEREREYLILHFKRGVCLCALNSKSPRTAVKLNEKAMEEQRQYTFECCYLLVILCTLRMNCSGKDIWQQQ